MSELGYYFSSNVPLFAITVVMLFIAIRNIKIRKQESILFISFVLIVLFLSAIVALEDHAQLHGQEVAGTIYTSLGYITRPILLYIFVLLTNMGSKRSRKFYYICTIPLLLNFIIYLFPFFFGIDGLYNLVFYYELQTDGTAKFIRGGFLNFFSHAVCLLYLAALVYICLVRFRGKHRRDGIVIMLCVVIIMVTVAVEMITNRSDLLNIVCDICMMINYIFIISINSSKDPLTDLYDRRTFNDDVRRYKNEINGVVQLDMNELKFVNDNYGHEAGDSALIFIAQAFESSLEQHTMCAYRLSGDEFVILMFNGKEEDLNNTIVSIKSKIAASEYTVAVGEYFIKKGEITNFDEAMARAESLMYRDKSEHYHETGHNRRKH